MLPQSTYMRQGGSDLCLHDDAGACSSGRRTYVRGPVRVTNTSEGGGLARGCGFVLDDQRSHWPCDGVRHPVRLLLLDATRLEDLRET